MVSYDIFIEAVKAILEALGFSVAIWIFLCFVIATNLWDMYQAHKFRKRLPKEIAAEIIKQSPGFSSQA